MQIELGLVNKLVFNLQGKDNILALVACGG